MAYQYKLSWSEVDNSMVEDQHKRPDRDYFQTVKDDYMREQSLSYSGTEVRIIEECNAIRDLLISKNRKYGNSVFDSGVFNISPVVAIKARIQDKLNRLKNDKDNEDEDVILDLLGYFILLRIAVKEDNS